MGLYVEINNFWGGVGNKEKVCCGGVSTCFNSKVYEKVNFLTKDFVANFYHSALKNTLTNWRYGGVCSKKKLK